MKKKYNKVLHHIKNNKSSIEKVHGNISSSYHSEFSNFSYKFKGWLDYIFYSPENMKLLQTLEVPKENELRDDTCEALGFTDLPNRIFPSDHLRIESIFELM